MKYFACACGHTTIDHGLHGKGDCLMDDCRCPKMDPKEELPARTKYHFQQLVLPKPAA